VRVYLDACCLSRLTDGLGQPRVREEAAAVLRIIDAVIDGQVVLVSSQVLQAEVERNPHLERRAVAEHVLGLALTTVPADSNVWSRAKQLLAFGFNPMDAAHFASAEAGRADVFLSTDDRLLKAAGRAAVVTKLRTANPVPWVIEAGYDRN
jgi:predicted nucleic acid-binding protein